MVDGDPPNLTRLIAALTRLGDPAAAERQAWTIYPIITAVVVQNHSRGHDIGRDASGFYARPRTSTAGPVRELRDLCAAANKAVAGRCDKEDWITAWAAVPDRTQHRLWASPLIRKASPFGSFSAPGYLTNVPRPDDALPVIKAELERSKTTPNTKLRKRNEEEHAAIAAIRHAYSELTGHKGGRVIADGRLAGRLFRLGREIDEIFGIKLFANKDSRRLR